VLGSLKQKMQTLRDELDKYKDLYEAKCHEVDRQVNTRDEVSVDFLLGNAHKYRTYTIGPNIVRSYSKIRIQTGNRIWLSMQ